VLANPNGEPSQRDDIFASQEGECDWPQDQPEQLDSVPVMSGTSQLSTAESEEERGRITDTEIQKGQVDTSATAGKPHSEKPEVDNMSEFNV
jgi:hypothetical protein